MSQPVNHEPSKHGGLSSLQTVDEHTPLLVKLPTYVSVEPLEKHSNSGALSVEQYSTRKLIWIMASVWVGTFCAGLGKFYHVCYKESYLS